VAGGRRVAVIGGGWAGLAAAVEATRRGHAVTLFEMAPHPGGRARDVQSNGFALDNGQHILIGAYVETLALMRTLEIDPHEAFVRMPLRVNYPDGAGLRLEPGAPALAFGVAVIRQRGWHLAERLALLIAAAGWGARGFRCDASLTVAALTRRLPDVVRHELIDPLCVAALNTPAAQASAQVFLRVLKDALFSGSGSADLLLPRVGLSALLPEPAWRRLQAAGADLRASCRVDSLQIDAIGWSVDGEAFDQVIIATSPKEAARLVEPIAPAWSRVAAGLRYEPIVTVYLHADKARLAAPMLALRASDEAPAQFVFDRGQLGGPAGLLAFVISGAALWVERGAAATEQATLAQARTALGLNPSVVKTLTEKRATFRCTPGLERPSMRIAGGLFAAGDHIDGPYPATLEGAVRHGLAAARALG
jgi:hydroxysqualene dehydroxylase